GRAGFLPSIARRRPIEPGAVPRHRGRKVRQGGCGNRGEGLRPQDSDEICATTAGRSTDVGGEERTRLARASLEAQLVKSRNNRRNRLAMAFRRPSSANRSGVNGGRRRNPCLKIAGTNQAPWKFLGTIDISLRCLLPRLIAVQHYTGFTRAYAFRPFAISNGCLWMK